ncbi:MAG TPA: hypothetical protein VN132_14110, partial [Bdellovibrio sp.]|nr:hypothetical protein [Bdellovibrio sp.]
MFSKALQCAVLIAVSATSLLSCGLRMGEKPSADQVYEFSGTACLSKAAPTVKEFVQGVAKDNDMKELWSCIGSAVDQFKKKVRGSTANQYSSQEIATFLETNFLDKKTKPKISPELQLEFMKIKQLFIGG